MGALLGLAIDGDRARFAKVAPFFTGLKTQADCSVVAAFGAELLGEEKRKKKKGRTSSQLSKSAFCS